MAKAVEKNLENTDGAAPAAESAKPVAAPALELVTSDKQVNQAILDAGAELSAAADAANATLVEEAAKVKPAADKAAEKPAGKARTSPTPGQRMRVAKRQREYGRKLLERTTVGVSSVNRAVKINNQPIRMMFERTWPYIDSCAYLLMRHGGFAVGDREATALLGALEKKVKEFWDEQDKNLQAARAVGEEAADKEDSFAVSFSQAMDQTVQVRSPIANKALEGFLKADGVLTELETLMWNNERTLSDIELETTQIRNQVRELGIFVVRTLNNLNTRYRARAAAN